MSCCHYLALVSFFDHFGLKACDVWFYIRQSEGITTLALNDFTCSTQGFYADIILNLISAHLLRFSALLPSIFFWLVKEYAPEPALFQYMFCRVPQLVSSWTAGVSKCMLEWSVKSRSAGLYFHTIQSLWHLCCNDGGVESLFQIMRPCFDVLML